VATDWLRQAIGLPAGFSGVINDTASTSTLYALTAAREAIPGLNVREQGVDGRRLRYYTSVEAHSSVEKAGLVLGTGQAGCVRIATDAEFRMRPDELESAIARDRAAGFTPFAVVPTIGTTSTTSIDPVPGIAEIARREGLWLHVDAAYGGAAAVLPSHRQVLAGCEHADSIVVNPHKWLFTPIDCSVLYTKRPAMLRDAFSPLELPPYLKFAEGAEINYMDFGLQLGRRFRALKLWMVMEHYGIERLRDVIREQVGFAQRLTAELRKRDDVELLAPQQFSVVVFRKIIPGDESASEKATNDAVERMNASGRLFVSTTRLRGKLGIRVAIGNGATEWKHVARILELL